MWEVVLVLGEESARMLMGMDVKQTLAALNPSLPCSSTSFSYPIGASSLYGPALLVSFTLERVGIVVVSVAEGAIL